MNVEGDTTVFSSLVDYARDLRQEQNLLRITFITVFQTSIATNAERMDFDVCQNGGIWNRTALTLTRRGWKL